MLFPSAQLTLNARALVGQKAAYDIQLDVAMENGQAQIGLQSSQVVMAVAQDGTATVESSSSDYAVMFGGTQAPAPTPPVFKLKIDSAGVPISFEGEPTGIANRLQLQRIAMVAYGHQLDLDKPLSIDWRSPANPKNHIEGTLTLNSVGREAASVIEKLKVYTAGSETPMRVNGTASFRLTDSALTSFIGDVSDIPAGSSRYSMSGAAFKIRLVKPL